MLTGYDCFIHAAGLWLFPKDYYYSELILAALILHIPAGKAKYFNILCGDTCGGRERAGLPRLSQVRKELFQIEQQHPANYQQKALKMVPAKGFIQKK